MREIEFRSDGSLGLNILEKITHGLQIIPSESVGNIVWESTLGYVNNDKALVQSYFQNNTHLLKSFGQASLLGGAFYMMGEGVRAISNTLYPQKTNYFSKLLKVIDQHPMTSLVATSLLAISAFDQYNSQSKNNAR